MSNWKHTIYFSDLRREGIGLAYRDRVAIAQRFRESAWFKDATENGYGDLADLLDELEELEDVEGSEDVEGFVAVMNAIYDEANYGRACFIDTVSPMPGTVRA
jgi:hypothetical protein